MALSSGQKGAYLWPVALTWQKVEIQMGPEVQGGDPELDLLSGLLYEMGASGLETLDQSSPICIAAAFHSSDPAATLAEVEAAVDAHGLSVGAVRREAYEPVDWSSHWRRHFRPLSFGRLVVVPTWLPVPDDAQAVLRIDPSSAFGTGIHPTTQLCLEEIVARSPFETILDVGTGTGILALAALRLGAQEATATDNDPEALRVAALNAQENHLTSHLHLSDRKPRALRRRFSCVVANIMKGPLIGLAPDLRDAASSGAVVLLSGILRTQADEVLDAYRTLGFEKEGVRHQDEWSLLALVAPRNASNRARLG